MSRQLRKQHLEIKGNEEHQEISENIPEDSLVDILDAIHSRNSSTEKLIVPKVTNKLIFFIGNQVSLETGSKKENSKNEKKKKKKKKKMKIKNKLNNGK